MNEVGNLPINCVFLHSHYRYYVPLRLPYIRNTISPSLYAFFFTFRWWVGSLQFRTTLFIHTVSYIPRDSSVLFSSFSTRSMVFAYFAKAQLPFSLFRDLFNDTAEFTLCYGLHDCSHLFQGYFIHSLSTLYYYNAPSLTTRLTGDYRDRTYTGKCSPALLDTHKKRRAACSSHIVVVK